MYSRPKKSKGRFAFFALVLIALIIGGVLFFNSNNEADTVSQSTQQQAPQTPEPEPEEEIKPTKSIPAAFELNVPFTPQAPTANWDELHQEACEEASAIMAHAYLNNIASLPPAIVEKEIDKLTKWQQDNYGYYLSITTEEAAKMIREVYDLKAVVVDMDETTIKEALLDNKVIIMPAQGQLLDNPNFTPPGPPYHMLVITGWNKTHFITNDPGTRRGDGYQYTYETLYDSSGLWEHSSYEVNTNIKEIIIVSK